MPRPTAGDPPNHPLSPYHTPPSGMAGSLAPAAPLSYAGQPVPPAPAAKSSPTPAGLFNAFKRRWVLGTFLGLLVAAGAAAVAFLLMPPGKHEARGLIDLRSRDNNLSFKNGDDYESYRRNQIFILKTRDLIRRTVDDPAVSSLEMIRSIPPEDRERMLEESMTATQAAPTILALTIKGNNLDEMKIIVDAHMKRYIDDAIAVARKEREDHIKKLERMEQSQRDEAEAIERQLMLMAKGTGATGGESAEKRLADLQIRAATIFGEIHQLDNEIDSADSARKVARKQFEQGQPPVDATLLKLAVNGDPRMIPLAAAAKKAKELLDDTIMKAPDPETSDFVKEARQDLAKAEQKLESMRKVVAGEMAEKAKVNGLLALQDEIATLEKKIAVATILRDKKKFDHDTIEKTIAGSAAGNLQVNSLLLGLAPQREAIVKIEQDLNKLRMAGNLDERERIRELAQSFPNTNQNRKLILSGGVGLGTFAMVILLVSFLEWRTRRVDSVDQVVSELGMRIIGTVPAFPNRASVKAATDSGGANWRFALNESINSTRTLLLHSARAQSMQVVMVTSATQGEGKTSLASQLASSMATAGMRTLVVDCDLRNPSIHKLFDLSLSNGVSEILTQEVDVADAVQPTAVPNLWVVTAGQCSNRVIAALAQGHPLETLFNRLRGQFDFIIVDSCPVLPVADALLIGQHVDGVVFSIMQDISQLPKVLLASEKLTHLNIPLLGAVVNGIKQDVYSYGYNYVKQLPA
jgi:polysaccharide biosynthesis transport protein